MLTYPGLLLESDETRARTEEEWPKKGAQREGQGQLPSGGGLPEKGSVVSLPNHGQHLPSFPLRGRKSMGPVHRVFRKRNAILEGASAKAEKCRNIPGNAVQSEPLGFALMGLGDGVPFNWDLSPRTPPLSFK